MTPQEPAVADDASVILRSRHEPETFAALFTRHAATIQRYVTRRLGPDAADDVVAETFLLAFRQRETYDPGRADALPWLYGIATNLIGRHRRDEIRLYRALARTGTDPVTAPFTDHVDDAVAASMAGRRLAAALARLPAGYRDPLRVVNNPTVGRDISYAELVRFKGDPRALANCIYHRETQIQGPESARQTWFDTFYEMTGVFGWFALPPRVAAEILRALPFVPGVKVQNVAGGIAFTSTGLARTDTNEGMTVTMTLNPVTFTATSVRISSGNFSNQFDLVTRAPVSGPGVRP